MIWCAGLQVVVDRLLLGWLPSKLKDLRRRSWLQGDGAVQSL